jgi:hypothetical protein
MVLIPNDLWAFIKPPSAKFDKCALHLNHYTYLGQGTSSYLPLKYGQRKNNILNYSKCLSTPIDT